MFNILFRVLVIAMFATALIAVLHSNLRRVIKNKIMPHQRVILSKISGPVLGKNSYANIFKIKTRNGIFLEVYKQNTSGGISPLIDKIKLPDDKEGYFDFQGQATNLGLADIDNDEVPEILAPSYDNKLNAHLNVYSYDVDSQKFKQISN